MSFDDDNLCDSFGITESGFVVLLFLRIYDSASASVRRTHEVARQHMRNKSSHKS